MIPRQCKPSKNNSFFLFGARGTGKTTMLDSLEFLNDALRIDLLLPEEETRYSLEPGQLLEVAARLGSDSWIVLDEVQKVPKLLDVVHAAIARHKVRFALTGSSARKLKRGGANLLAGRAFVYHLFPFTSSELGSAFRLNDALRWGTLPGIYELDRDADRARFLNAYAHTYVREEIQVEQLVRKLDPFRLFLRVAAQMNAEVLNYSNVARDTGVDVKSVQNYFQILTDTYLGFFLTPTSRSVRRSQRQNPKFYFFDTGVLRSLQQQATIPLQARTAEFGSIFETWFIGECVREIAYRENDYQLSYLRTRDGVEIDLVIERPGKSTALVEIKSTEKVDDRHVRSLHHFAKDFPKAQLICASRDPTPRQQQRVHILPWDQALEAIFS